MVAVIPARLEPFALIRRQIASSFKYVSESREPSGSEIIHRSPETAFTRSSAVSSHLSFLISFDKPPQASMSAPINPDAPLFSSAPRKLPEMEAFWFRSLLKEAFVVTVLTFTGSPKQLAGAISAPSNVTLKVSVLAPTVNVTRSVCSSAFPILRSAFSTICGSLSSAINFYLHKQFN